jgi:P4 family phage/plasmid primase-like protien
MAGELSQPTNMEQKMSVKIRQATLLRNKYRIVRFRGAVLWRTDDGWEPLSSDEFARMCYSVLGAGIRRTQILDLQHLFFTSSEDLTPFAHYIAMPDGRVWDMKELDFTADVSPEDCVYTTAVSPTTGTTHRKWLEEVTLGDKELADDVLTALAPVFMHKKPLGAFWFLGSGANGKSTTLKSLIAIMGTRRWFSKLTVKQIEDERDLPSMNGMLANICIESNEGYIKDGGRYKELAEHETLSVHKFNSQESIAVDGNVHLIFNANNIPTFADKTNGVRRRTFTIPFNAKFPQDDTFDERLFATPNLLSDLFGEILAKAQQLKRNNYKYNFSKITNEAKERYDSEVNTAEAYLHELIEQEVYGFTTYAALKTAYTVWCEQNGLVPLGMRHLSRTAEDLGFKTTVVKVNQESKRFVLYKDYKLGDLEPVDKIGFGLYRLSDSEKQLVLPDDPNEDSLNQMLELL